MCELLNFGIIFENRRYFFQAILVFTQIWLRQFPVLNVGETFQYSCRLFSSGNISEFPVVSMTHICYPVMHRKFPNIIAFLENPNIFSSGYLNFSTFSGYEDLSQFLQYGLLDDFL
jgi:hypothetical protein